MIRVAVYVYARYNTRMPRPNRTGKVRARIRDWLKAERQTQEWLAQQIGDVHQTTVSHWYRGGEIPLNKALRIQEITGLSVEDIAVIEDVPQPAESSGHLPDSDSGDDAA